MEEIWPLPGRADKAFWIGDEIKAKETEGEERVLSVKTIVLEVSDNNGKKPSKRVGPVRFSQ